MKRLLGLFLFGVAGLPGFSQDLPFPYGGVIPNYTNVIVRWKASKHPWPKELWTYQMIPRAFPPSLISNLMELGNFTEKDRWGVPSTNGVTYFDWKNRLRISFATGEIDFDRELGRYSLTNLAKDVPTTNQLFKLATNFLPNLGLDISEIPKTKNGRLQIHCSEPSVTEYSVGETTVTNIQFRHASFGRLIDGVECDAMVGSCGIDFGERGQIKAISLYWRNLKRDKFHSSVTPDQIVRWIRSNKIALPKEMYVGGGNTTAIDWTAVKGITINEATAHYWGEFFLGERERRPIFPSSIGPYAILLSTIDTGKTNLNVKIVCPIIDESKPLN